MKATSSLSKLTVQSIICAAAIFCFAPVDPNPHQPQEPNAPEVARHERIPRDEKLPLQYILQARELAASPVRVSPPNAPSAVPVVYSLVFSHPNEPKSEPNPQEV